MSTTPAAAVHTAARLGFTDGELYDRARPDFPSELIALVRAGAKTEAAGLHVLEVASGTGKFTALLEAAGLARPPHRLLCVEPSAGFRAAFAARFPGVECVAGDATHLPPAGPFDVVCAAQAFHWFADAASLRSLHGALRRGGQLLLVWNMEDDAEPWVRDLRAVYEAFDGAVPQYRTGAWRAVFDDAAASGAAELFELPLVHTRVRRDVRVPDFEAVWLRVLSKSYVQALPEADRNDLRRRVLAVLERHKESIRRDTDGQILYPYVTDAYVAVAK
ncbi:hypothetical protein HK405_010937 [Cladochytrium tenue]|nr:hypothetical protein HK405_010937 [Cladochytrium tenue]